MNTGDIMTMVAAVLSGTAVIAAWRVWRVERRGSVLRTGLQTMLAGLLFAVLFPPVLRVSDDALTVLTADASAQQRRAAWWRHPLQRRVALPEADGNAGPDADIERVPDLATALRRYPSIQQLDVLGRGLRPRDQAIAASRGLRFKALPARGLVALDAPARVAQGTQWALAGMALPPATRVELRDPSGAVVESANLPADGRFGLSAFARAAGTVQYALRVLGPEQALIDHATVPLVVTPGEVFTVILRSGAPDPDTKYWRRRASDAGLTVRASAGLSANLNLRDGDVRLTPAALAEADLVIIDDRAWSELAAEEKSALSAAVQTGLGLLLKAGGPLDAAVAGDWAALGFRGAASEAASSVTLDGATGLHERAPFTAAAVAFESDSDTTPLLRADGNDEALALWRSAGQGRVAVWRLVDSYRLVLFGEPARYGKLWQSVLATLSRARPPESVPKLPQDTWIDQRCEICGVAAGASVRSPGGHTVPLLVDSQACAAYWPAEAGWHAVQTGGTSHMFYVRAADDARGLQQQRDRTATAALVRETAADARSAAARSVALPRWPLLLAWLLLATSLWWRERPR